MSGGVDSAVAALLAAPSAARRRCARSSCGRTRRTTARRAAARRRPCAARASLPTGSGMPHLSIDLRGEFRAGVVDGWLAGHAAGLTPNPCVRCNGSVRLDAMLELAGSARRRRARHRPLRARRAPRRDGRCCAPPPTRPRTRATCSPALAPESLARLRFPLGDAAQARGPRAGARRRAGGRATSPTRRTSASWPAPAAKRSSSATAACARRPGEIRRRATAASSASTRGAHLYTVGQRHGLGVAAGEPLYVLAHRRAREHGHGRRARGRSAPSASRCGTLDAASRRAGRRRGARARARAARSSAVARARLGAGRHERAEVALLVAAERTAPGQVACLYAGELVVGHGDDRSASRALQITRTRADLRRDPRALPVASSRSAITAHPVGVARALRARPLGAVDGRRHAPAEAVLPRAGDAAGAAADRAARRSSARSTSTTSATPRGI